MANLSTCWNYDIFFRSMCVSPQFCQYSPLSQVPLKIPCYVCFECTKGCLLPSLQLNLNFLIPKFSLYHMDRNSPIVVQLFREDISRIFDFFMVIILHNTYIASYVFMSCYFLLKKVFCRCHVHGIAKHMCQILFELWLFFAHLILEIFYNCSFL